LIRTFGSSPESGHNYQPAICQLIVANNGVAVVGGFARAAKALEDRVGGYRTVNRFPGLFEKLPLLREDRQPGVNDLEDVIFTDGQAVV
jgi:hypothetical protein